MGKKSGSGPGIRDEQPGSYFLELRNHFFGLTYLNSMMLIRDPGWKQFGSGMETIRIRDPGWKKVGSGIGDKYPGSATNTAIFSLTFFSIFIFSLYYLPLYVVFILLFGTLTGK